MASGIGVAIMLSGRGAFEAAMRCLLTSAMQGYLRPQCAYTRLGAAPVGGQGPLIVSEKLAGGFAPFASERESGAPGEEFLSEQFRLLPGETMDENPGWTTLECPSCEETVLDWLDQSRDAKSVQIAVLGSIPVFVEGDESSPRRLFRELQPVSDNFGGRKFHLADGDYAGVALLRVCGMVQASGESGVVLTSHSQLWLEHGQAFRGLARRYARTNTEALAERVRTLVSQMPTLVAIVEWWPPEGVFAREGDRLWSTFRTIPGMEVG